jgi:hypothetical protein
VTPPYSPLATPSAVSMGDFTTPPMSYLRPTVVHQETSVSGESALEVLMSHVQEVPVMLAQDGSSATLLHDANPKKI